MNGAHLDQFAKALAATAARRRLLMGLSVASAGGLLGRGKSARAQDDGTPQAQMSDCPLPMNDLVEGVREQGLSGLFRVLRLEIDPNGIAAECIAESDGCFESAADGEQVWGCAIDMARCLSSAPIDEPPELKDPPPPTPHQRSRLILGRMIGTVLRLRC
jgi:hypothetical protein